MLPAPLREDTQSVAPEERILRPAPAERRSSPSESLLQRFRGEYLEMPGLRLTLEQAQRLFAVDRSMCQTVLGALVKENFLSLKSNGTYARATDGRWPAPVPAKAELPAPRRSVTAV